MKVLGVPLRLGRVEARQHELHHRLEHARDCRADQVILGGEMVSDHSPAHPGPAGHLAHRGALEAELDDGVDRAVHKLITALELGERAGFIDRSALLVRMVRD
jgi:hypothetical protein